MTDYIKGILAELEEEYEVDYKADLIVQACNFDGTPGEIVGRWHQWCCRDDDRFRATSWSEEDEWCDDDKVADAAINYLYDHLNDGMASWYSDGFGDGLVIVGSRETKTVFGRDYVFDLDIIVETREKEEEACGQIPTAWKCSSGKASRALAFLCLRMRKRSAPSSSRKSSMRAAGPPSASSTTPRMMRPSAASMTVATGTTALVARQLRTPRSCERDNREEQTMVLDVTASIGEWTSSYSTTHYDIRGAYLESVDPDLFSAIIGTANKMNDECETMQAVASRLFRDREVDRVCPTVGGPVPEFSKAEFEALVYECIRKGQARIEIERNEGYVSYSFKYEWKFEEGDVNRDVIFHVYMS